MILLFPTEMEAARLRALRPELDIRICGVGVVECALAVQEILAERREILLCGIAGAYDHTLQKGAVVAVTEERFCHLSSGYHATYHATIIAEGLEQVVSNTVSQCGAEAEGAVVENMEGAMLFALAAKAGVPCGEIRAISNYVGEARDRWKVELALDNLTAYIAKHY